MIRRPHTFATISLLVSLAACGGGGHGGSLPPTSPVTPAKKLATATFKFKIPSKTTMSSLRRPAYVSQATEGVAIDWISTNPDDPDYAAAISAACPTTYPAGVTGCTVESSGTVYTFQLAMPSGTYSSSSFTVTTFDQPPSRGGIFTGSMLAQGQTGESFVISVGATNSIPGLTFYGIPASVSLVPAPGQSHVMQYGGTTTSSGSGPQLAIIGAQPQTFFAEPLDADGFIISNNDGTGGVPSVSVAEGSDSCSPACFAIATPGPTASPNTYTLTAQSASATAVIDASASYSSGVTVNGTSGTAVTTAYSVQPVQELWTTVETVEPPFGIFGYALYPNEAVDKPIDGYVDTGALCAGDAAECDFDAAAIDPTDGTIYTTFISSSDDIPGIYAFTQGTGSQGIVPQASAAHNGIAGDIYESVAIDTQQHAFLVDNDSGITSLEVYSTVGSGWSPLTSSNIGSIGAADTVAVAPSAANVPSALVGSLWVGLNTEGFDVFPAYTGGSLTSSPANPTSNPAYPIEVDGFDSAGDLWATDGTNLYVYEIGGTPAAPTLSLIESNPLANAGDVGSSFGAAANQEMWFGQGNGITGFNLFKAGCSGCGIVETSDALSTNAGSFAAFVTP